MSDFMQSRQQQVSATAVKTGRSRVEAFKKLEHAQDPRVLELVSLVFFFLTPDLLSFRRSDP
jgi:hypothetical protein